MPACQPCRAFLQKHRRAVRWLVFLGGLALFFFVLGRYATPVYGPGFCSVYR
ncbi:MAG: hypothetical protein OSW77_00075 [Proteobacteria bacterium]|nr:hypothetical protein [Pseudomonadota bacterium]